MIVYAVMEHIEQSLSDVLQTQTLTAGRRPRSGRSPGWSAHRDSPEGHVAWPRGSCQRAGDRGDGQAAQRLPASQRCWAGRGRGGHRHDPVPRLHAAKSAYRYRCANQSHPSAVRGDYPQLLCPALDVTQIANALKPGQPAAPAVPPAPVRPPARRHRQFGRRLRLQFAPRLRLRFRLQPAPEHEPIVVKVVDPAAPSYRPAAPPPGGETAPVGTLKMMSRRLRGESLLRSMEHWPWWYWRSSPGYSGPSPHRLLRTLPFPKPQPSRPRHHQRCTNARASPGETGSGEESAAAKPAPADRQTASAAAPKERTIWRVVVYTYRSQKLAEEKASQITGKYPDLSASVFSPPGHSDTYLVILGGAMDRQHRLTCARKRSVMGCRGIPMPGISRQ